MSKGFDLNFGWEEEGEEEDDDAGLAAADGHQTQGFVAEAHGALPSSNEGDHRESGSDDDNYSSDYAQSDHGNAGEEVGNEAPTAAADEIDETAADLEAELEMDGQDPAGQKGEEEDSGSESSSSGGEKLGFDLERLEKQHAPSLPLKGQERTFDIDFDEKKGNGSDGSDYNAVDSEDEGEVGDAAVQSEEKKEPEEPAIKKHVIIRRRTTAAPNLGSAAAGLGQPGGKPLASSGLAGGASVEDVAGHYNRRDNQRRDVRDSSPIITLKKLNNWIKSVLIRRYTKEGDAVLDLACGKGGDLMKWDHAKIGFYLGVDVAEGSIIDAAARYNGESDTDGRMSKKFRFPAKLVVADCFGYPLATDLAQYGPFDVCSCQFALHYSFQSEERARQALENVSSLLAPGGYFIGTTPDANVIVKKLRAAPGLKFGNLVYSIEFVSQFASKTFPKSNPFGVEYLFNLEDAVACPEWLIPFPCLQKLAEEYDLELVEKMNFHEFIHHYTAEKELAQIMMRVVGQDWPRRVTPDEWDAAYLYCAYVFRKKGEKNTAGKRRREHTGFKKIEDGEILFLG